MREVKRIVDQLNRAFNGDAWHGPAVMEALKGVTAYQAAVRPIPGAHSIWEITHHIGTWNEVVRLRVLGEKVVITDEDNFPIVGKPSPSAWKRTLAGLKAKHEAFTKVVASMSDDRLNVRPRRGVPTYYAQIHGVIQHDLYHAGQIVLLKRALKSRK